MSKKQSNIESHLELLGYEAKDKISSLKGIVTSISFDLYGCIQACLDVGFDNEGKRKESYWFDVTRLKIIGKKRKMEMPEFKKGYISEGKKGAAFKPAL